MTNIVKINEKRSKTKNIVKKIKIDYSKKLLFLIKKFFKI